MARKIVDNSMTAPRSVVNVNCNWTGTADFGRLIPIHIEELNPTDKITNFRPKVEIQLLSLAAPTFGKIDCYLHAFFVPTRLCWKDFNDYHSRQGEGKNSTPPYVTLYDIAHNYQSASSAEKRILFKHLTSLGLPPFFAYNSFNVDNEANARKLTQLKFRAYTQIWWDFYRDPEVLRDENKSDYISDRSGHEPLDTRTTNGYKPKWRTITNNWIAELFADNGQLETPFGVDFPQDVNPNFNPQWLTEDYEVQTFISTDENKNVKEFYADYPGASENGNAKTGQFTSADFRKFEALTRLSERLSLAGKRQIDALYARFGVKPEWSKLNMCQYVGGAKQEIYVADIISNADTQAAGEGAQIYAGSPLGAKGGTGYCALQNFNVNYTAEEDGYFICLLSIMPHVHFVQGINKSWFRNDREDWFTKTLERTGQVAVRKDEIGIMWNTGAGATSPVYDRSEDADTFAFTQPYYELKHGQDILAGDFMYYHGYLGDDDPEENKNLAYMNSLEMYVDYPKEREFSYDGLLLNPMPFNRIFNYQGGGIWSDADDHFQICIDKEIEKETIMDGYAVPTIETTEDPHAAKAAIGKDTIL